MTKQKQITLSHSQKQLYKQCKRKWYLKYERELDEGIESEALVFGSFVHIILEQYMTGAYHIFRQHTIDKFEVKMLTDKVYDNLEDKEMLNVDSKYLVRELTTQALRVLQADFKEIYIFNDKPAIELQLTVDGFYTGVIDLVYIDKQGKTVLLDWKTTSRLYTKHQVKQHKQLKGYAWLLAQHNVTVDTLACGVIHKVAGIAKIMKVKNNQDYKDFVRDVKEVRLGVETVLRLHRGESFLECFPRNEEVCFAYNTRCSFYDQCWSEDTRIVETIDLIPKLG